MENNKILIIGMVWPEPESSAAGIRIIQLIKFLLSRHYQLTFASAAAKSEFSFNLEGLQVKERQIKLNDSSFDTFLQELHPAVIIYDRFITEEQYGWRVNARCPEALTILDTEDLHMLRRTRQEAHKQQKEFQINNLFSDSIVVREISSILRCDLSLIISEVEMQLLLREFRIDPSQLFYLPFLEEKICSADMQKWKDFTEREGFVFIGNYLHEPNWLTVRILKTEIWPVLSQKLPGINIHIYGAYAGQKVLQLHQVKERFYVHGRAKDAGEAIARHRVLLAPIPFGAGLKGKLIHAMQTGTPSVTTSAGAEGMPGEFDWNGFITDRPGDFIDYAVKLYTDQHLWLQARQKGTIMINERYEKTKFLNLLERKLNELFATLAQHRQHNFFGRILHYQSFNSTKYMALWIEQKNKPMAPR